MNRVNIPLENATEQMSPLCDDLIPVCPFLLDLMLHVGMNGTCSTLHMHIQGTLQGRKGGAPKLGKQTLPKLTLPFLPRVHMFLCFCYLYTYCAKLCSDHMLNLFPLSSLLLPVLFCLPGLSSQTQASVWQSLSVLTEPRAPLGGSPEPL